MLVDSERFSKPLTDGAAPSWAYEEAAEEEAPPVEFSQASFSENPFATPALQPPPPPPADFNPGAGYPGAAVVLQPPPPPAPPQSDHDNASSDKDQQLSITAPPFYPGAQAAEWDVGEVEYMLRAAEGGDNWGSPDEYDGVPPAPPAAAAWEGMPEGVLPPPASLVS